MSDKIRVSLSNPMNSIDDYMTTLEELITGTLAPLAPRTDAEGRFPRALTSGMRTPPRSWPSASDCGTNTFGWAPAATRDSTQSAMRCAVFGDDGAVLFQVTPDIFYPPAVLRCAGQFAAIRSPAAPYLSIPSHRVSAAALA